jgi:hypothetical protein
VLARKSQIRNPKHEIRNKFKIRNLKSQTKRNPEVSNIGSSDLEFVSNFGFRTFGFPSPARRMPKRHYFLGLQ